MAVFVMMEADSFGSSRAEVKGGLLKSSEGTFVRRPTRGIVLREDTYSVIRVLRNGKGIPLRNSSGEDSKTAMTANYLLQAVTEVRQEKSQLLQTFGETYGFFFGETPRVLHVAGVLLNTPDFNWRAEWMLNYEEVFCATKLAQRGARMYLQFNDTVVEGYMLSTKVDTSVQSPNHVGMSFSMWVTHQMELGDVGSIDFPQPQRLTLADLPGVAKRLSPGGTLAAIKEIVSEHADTQFHHASDEYMHRDARRDSYAIGQGELLRKRWRDQSTSPEALARKAQDSLLSTAVMAKHTATVVARAAATTVALAQNFGSDEEKAAISQAIRDGEQKLAEVETKKQMFGAYAMDAVDLLRGDV